MKRLVLKKERVSICSEATGENMERGEGGDNSSIVWTIFVLKISDLSNIK